MVIIKKLYDDFSKESFDLVKSGLDFDGYRSRRDFVIESDYVALVRAILPSLKSKIVWKKLEKQKSPFNAEKMTKTDWHRLNYYDIFYSYHI